MENRVENSRNGLLTSHRRLSPVWLLPSPVETRQASLLLRRVCGVSWTVKAKRRAWVTWARTRSGSHTGCGLAPIGTATGVRQKLMRHSDIRAHHDEHLR